MTVFESKATEDLVTARDRIIAGVWSIATKIVTGEPVNGEAKAMVPVQVALVASMDTVLTSRGVSVPAPFWA